MHHKPLILTVPVEEPDICPKLVPVIVMGMPPPVGPVLGEIEEMTGAVYENAFARVASCPETVMATAKFVPMPLGDTHVAVVCTRPGDTILQDTPPRVMVPKTPKFEPDKVIVAPPEVKSLDGLMEVIEGAA